MEKYLKTIEDAKYDETLLTIGGGKFYGLCQADNILRRMPQNDEIRVRIPKTCVIPFSVFEKFVPELVEDIDSYFDKLTLPPDLLFEVKYFLASLGGRVAIRSSAQGEDGHDADAKGCRAGVYKSYLHTNISNIQKNIIGVLKSSYNPLVMAECADHKELKMAVVLQEMVKPKIAGVIFSEPFVETDGCDPDAAKAVIHYVENTTADKMIVNKEEGFIRKMDKFITTGYGSQFEFCDIGNLKRDRMYAGYLRDIKEYYGKDDDKYEHAFLEASLMKLTAISNYFEQTLKRPCDMEWVVEADPYTGFPLVNIVQQRPYKILDNFRIRRVNPQTIVGYQRENSELSAEAVLVEGNADPEFEYWNVPDFQGKIAVLKERTLEETGYNQEEYDCYLQNTRLLHQELMGRAKYKSAEAVIDTTNVFMSALYGHYGNELRRNEVPFVITCDKKFSRIEDGDKLHLQMKSGCVKFVDSTISPQKKAGLGQIISALQGYHK